MAMSIPASTTAAIFVDKDGTLIENLPYNVDPSRIVLRADAGPALARLQAAGFALVLVSNQPGVAEGRFAECALAAVWAEIRRQLAAHGVQLQAIYYCPHHPLGNHRLHARPCCCRKPRPGMLWRAAFEHGIDLDRSWLIGDILDDIEAGHAAGCRTVLLDVGSETEWRLSAPRQPEFVALSLAAAADCILHPLPPTLEPQPAAALPAWCGGV